MPEVGAFLREAWDAAERARMEAEAEVDNARIAEEVADLEGKIAIENAEIASAWRITGTAVAVEAGIALVAQLSASALNNANSGKAGCGGIFLGLLGGLGVFVFGLAFWIGLVGVAAIVLGQLVNLITRHSKVAALENAIRSLRAGRR